jgi:preprotein translocase subunit SecE
MNRQAKRMMQRQKATPQDRAQAVAQRQRVAERRQRTSAPQYLREVRAELRKVQWPTRQELVSYSIVVLVAVVVLTSYVFGLDLAFSKAILKILGPA